MRNEKVGKMGPKYICISVCIPCYGGVRRRRRGRRRWGEEKWRWPQWRLRQPLISHSLSLSLLLSLSCASVLCLSFLLFVAGLLCFRQTGIAAFLLPFSLSLVLALCQTGRLVICTIGTDEMVPLAMVHRLGCGAHLSVPHERFKSFNNIKAFFQLAHQKISSIE